MVAHVGALAREDVGVHSALRPAVSVHAAGVDALGACRLAVGTTPHDVVVDVHDAMRPGTTRRGEPRVSANEPAHRVEAILAAAEIEGVLRCGRRGEERKGDDVEGVVGEGRRRRGGSSRQGDHLGCRRERQQGAQQEDGRRRRQPVEEVGSHGASMRRRRRQDMRLRVCVYVLGNRRARSEIGGRPRSRCRKRSQGKTAGGSRRGERQESREEAKLSNREVELRRASVQEGA